MKIQRPNIKINKTWLMLIVAILLALLTAWLTLQYLTQKEQSIAAEIQARSEKGRGTTIAVAVPTRALPAGTLLDESVVAAREVPVDFVGEDAITVAQFDSFKGQALLRSVERGKPIRKSDVQEIFADFSGSLKAGKRAITINVDEINSVAHMVEPGNKVDLMLVLAASEGSSNQTVVPFLDQVKVLATGQKVRAEEAPLDATGQPRRLGYTTFTLEVTPPEAARLTLATELGKIRAVLRNASDTKSVEFDSVNAANLMEDILARERKAAAARPRTAANASTYVEYFIGGKAGNDAVAPVINIPMMPGTIPGAGTQPQASAGDAAGAKLTAQAAAANPQSVSDLMKLTYSAKAAAATSTK